MTAMRVVAAGLAAGTMLLGLAVRVGGLPQSLAKPLGVVLWCTLVYWCVRCVMPMAGVWRTACLAAAIGWAVEWLQLTGVLHDLAEILPLARWVLGTTFHAPDLVAYPIGAALGAGMHLALRPVGWWPESTPADHRVSDETPTRPKA